LNPIFPLSSSDVGFSGDREEFLAHTLLHRIYVWLYYKTPRTMSLFHTFGKKLFPEKTP